MLSPQQYCHILEPNFPLDQTPVALVAARIIDRKSRLDIRHWRYWFDLSTSRSWCTYLSCGDTEWKPEDHFFSEKKIWAWDVPSTHHGTLRTESSMDTWSRLLSHRLWTKAREGKRGQQIAQVRIRLYLITILDCFRKMTTKKNVKWEEEIFQWRDRRTTAKHKKENKNQEDENEGQEAGRTKRVTWHTIFNKERAALVIFAKPGGLDFCPRGRWQGGLSETGISCIEDVEFNLTIYTI